MFIPPMLLEKRESPFDDDRYIYEPKIDGHRLIMSIQGDAVRLYTRHNNDVTRQYPELHNAPISDTSGIVLDGEVAVVNTETGAVEFESVMERFMLKKELRIREASVRQPVHFFVFDILRYKGKDLRGRPLMERKLLLDDALTNNAFFSKVIRVDGTGKRLFDLIKQRGLEGIVAKRQDSLYVGRRDANWLKIINYQYETVHIAGYRKNQFGWLLQRDGRGVGLLELSVPPMHRKAFYGVAKSLVTGEDRDYVYMQPTLRTRVRFRNWTRSGLLRMPEFVRFVM